MDSWRDFKRDENLKKNLLTADFTSGMSVSQADLLKTGEISYNNCKEGAVAQIAAPYTMEFNALKRLKTSTTAPHGGAGTMTSEKDRTLDKNQTTTAGSSCDKHPFKFITISPSSVIENTSSQSKILDNMNKIPQHHLSEFKFDKIKF